MRSATTLLLIAAALAAPAAGLAQAAGGGAQALVLAGYDDLEEKDQRRLDFYADKILVEIRALMAARDAGDVDAFSRHGTALKTTAERFLSAAEGSGLTGEEADRIFHRHLAEGLSGPLPDFMIGDWGPAGVAALSTLEVEPPQPGGSDYVNAIRSAGETLFDN